MSSFANRKHAMAFRPACWLARGAWLGVVMLLYACTSEPSPTTTTAISAPTANESRLTAVMAAELAVSRGWVEQASERYETIALASEETPLIERAVHLALLVDQPTRVVTLLEHWLSLEPQQIQARQLLAIMQLRAGKSSLAIATLQTGLPAAGVERDAALASLGARLRDPSLPAEALEVMQALAGALPESAVAQLALAQVALARDHPELAKQAVAVTLDERADWPPALLLKADILLELERPNAALGVYKRLIQSSKASAPVHFRVAQLAIEVGQTNYAIDVFNQAITDYPDHEQLRYGRGIAYAVEGQPGKAEADWRWIIEKDPNNAQALNALGYTLVDQTDRVDEGQALIERAFAITPDDPAIIDSMGWALFRQGEIEPALDFLRRAYAQAPENAEIAAHLGEALWVLERKTEAQAIWQEALDAFPDDKTLKETLERLLP
ncbi:MAG: tetratricopeptide repeat protein [Spiribacter sp.]|nr:tetratricopeptide repeat protein [Spiribacter sp.]MDR9489510.1 tetratricopeptide repeat protein [Spiribacter sp.]